MSFAFSLSVNGQRRDLLAGGIHSFSFDFQLRMGSVVLVIVKR